MSRSHDDNPCSPDNQFVCLFTHCGQMILVSEEDADLGEYTWYLTKRHKSPYAFTADPRITGGKQSAFIHRLILGRMLGRELNRLEYTDHINGNPLDCQRHNLRKATPSQSAANRGMRRDSSSGFKGVAKTCSGRWRAQITINGCKENLGRFDTPEQASDAYNKRAREALQEYARPRDRH
jgi:hypothetical protein